MSQLLTTRQVAERLQLSPKTVLGLVQKGTLKPVKLSQRSFRFHPEQLEAATAAPSTESSEGGRD